MNLLTNVTTISVSLPGRAQQAEICMSDQLPRGRHNARRSRQTICLVYTYSYQPGLHESLVELVEFAQQATRRNDL